MDSINPSYSVLRGGENPAAEKSPQAVAQEFESLLITQLLRAGRTSEGWMGSGEDQTAGPAIEMAEEYLAKSMAAQGGLGLARLMTEHLLNPPAGQSE
ncbi:MAG: hypothetical protein JNL98_09855 [Bryobacterales bacterium]|nr:hypothetical protein [Bryobacterales bacterium]